LVILWARFPCTCALTKLQFMSFWLKQPWRILVHTLYPAIKFDSLVFIEPMLYTARHFKTSGHELRLHDLALARRDFWESKEEALKSLSAKGMKAWDERVRKLFVVSRIPPRLPVLFYMPNCSHSCLRRSLVFGTQQKMTHSIDLV
jgi:hypothetical protein